MSIGERTVRLWSVRERKEIRQWAGLSASAPWFLAGGKVVALSYSPVVRLWETSTGRPLPSFVGNRGAITGIAVSSQSSLFASASYMDQTVVVWDTERLLRRKAFSEALEPPCWEFLWNGLAAEYVDQDAFMLLAAYPRQTVAELKRRIALGKVMSAEVLPLIGKLGDDDFTVRQAAHKRIEEIGVVAIPFLKRFLEGCPDAETRLRAERLLKTIELDRPGEERRAKNAYRLLEELARHPGEYPWVLPAQKVLKSLIPPAAGTP